MSKLSDKIKREKSQEYTWKMSKKNISTARNLEGYSIPKVPPENNFYDYYANKQAASEDLSAYMQEKMRECCCVPGCEDIQSKIKFQDCIIDLELRSNELANFDGLISKLDKIRRLAFAINISVAINNLKETKAKLLEKEGDEKSMEGLKMEDYTEFKRVDSLRDRLDEILKEMTEIHRGNIVDNAYTNDISEDVIGIADLLKSIQGVSIDLLKSFEQTAKTVKAGKNMTASEAKEIWKRRGNQNG